MVIGILAVIILLSVVIGIFLFRLLTQNKIIISLLTIVLTIIFLAFALVYVVPAYNTWAYENTILNKYPFIKLLKEKSPDEYNAYLAKIKKDMTSNPSAAKVDTATFLNGALVKYSQNASNKSLCDYAKSRVDTYTRLVNLDPTYVLIIEFPKHFQGKYDVNALDKTIQDIGNTIILAKGDVIASAISNPQPPLSDADIQQAKGLIEEIGKNLALQYGKDAVLLTLRTPEDPSLDKKTGAAIIISLYQAILSHDENECGMIMKYNLLDANNV